MVQMRKVRKGSFFPFLFFFKKGGKKKKEKKACAIPRKLFQIKKIKKKNGANS